MLDPQSSEVSLCISLAASFPQDLRVAVFHITFHLSGNRAVPMSCVPFPNRMYEAAFYWLRPLDCLRDSVSGPRLVHNSTPEHFYLELCRVCVCVCV